MQLPTAGEHRRPLIGLMHDCDTDLVKLVTFDSV